MSTSRYIFLSPDVSHMAKIDWIPCCFTLSTYNLESAGFAIYLVWLPLATSSPLPFMKRTVVKANDFPTTKLCQLGPLPPEAVYDYICHRMLPVSSLARSKILCMGDACLLPSKCRQSCHQNWGMWLRPEVIVSIYISRIRHSRLDWVKHTVHISWDATPTSGTRAKRHFWCSG